MKSQVFRAKHSAANPAAIEQIREKLQNGPNFQDFVQNPELTSDEWKQYEGKLKREKNDNERLRLPPWLKVPIPMGERSSRLKSFTVEVKNFEIQARDFPKSKLS